MNGKTFFFCIVIFILAMFIIGGQQNPNGNGGKTNSSQINVSQNVGINGTLAAGIYDSSSCTNPLQHIYWGNISLGGLATRQIWVRDEEPFNITLAFRLIDFNPAWASNLRMTADYVNGTWLTPGQVIPIALTLHAPMSANYTSFFFNIQLYMRNNTR